MTLFIPQRDRPTSSTPLNGSFSGLQLNGTSTIRQLDADLRWLEDHGMIVPQGPSFEALIHRSSLATTFRVAGELALQSTPEARMHVVLNQDTSHLLLLTDRSEVFRFNTMIFDTRLEVLNMLFQDHLIRVEDNAFRSLKACNARIESFVALPMNWNGHHSSRISSKAVQVAHKLLEEIFERFWSYAREDTFPQIIVPVADGGIQFEWRSRTHEIEIGIDAFGQIGCLYVDVDHDEFSEEAENVPRSTVFNLLQKFLTSQIEPASAS
jgi:hypothetical protein